MSEYLELPWSVEDTIENMKKLKEVLQKMCITDNLDGHGEKDAEEVAFDFNRAIKALEEIQRYHAIGTPEECRAAVEKQMRIKVGRWKDGYACCPMCRRGVVKEDRYCCYCGQKLDWGDVE